MDNGVVLVGHASRHLVEVQLWGNAEEVEYKRQAFRHTLRFLLFVDYRTNPGALLDSLLCRFKDTCSRDVIVDVYCSVVGVLSCKALVLLLRCEGGCNEVFFMVREFMAERLQCKLVEEYIRLPTLSTVDNAFVREAVRLIR